MLDYRNNPKLDTIMVKVIAEHEKKYGLSPTEEDIREFEAFSAEMAQVDLMNDHPRRAGRRAAGRRT